MTSQKETATIQTMNEKAMAERERIVLKNYHTKKYLESKSKGKEVTYILPNGKELNLNERKGN